jgi:pilus assembly protein CpaB
MDNKVDPKALSSVTLLVTPDQANVLDLAQNMGTLSLALRNSSDVADSNVQPATLAEIRRLAMPPQDTPTPMFLDGDLPPPEALAALMGSAPRASRRPEPKWIDTMRGSQRGRVVVSER